MQRKQLTANANNDTARHLTPSVNLEPRATKTDNEMMKKKKSEQKEKIAKTRAQGLSLRMHLHLCPRDDANVQARTLNAYDDSKALLFFHLCVC